MPIRRMRKPDRTGRGDAAGGHGRDEKMKTGTILMACLAAAILLAASGIDAQAQRRDSGDRGSPAVQDDQYRSHTGNSRSQRRDREEGRPERQGGSRSSQGERATPQAQPRTQRPRTQQPRSASPAVRSPRATSRQAQPRSGSRRVAPPWHPQSRAPAPRRLESRRHWSTLRTPHHVPLRRRHYDHIWWCGPGCRLAFLFAFTTWTVPMVVDDDTDGYWPLWEALEYSPTNQTSLWESDWGYVEFTPIATYRSTYWVIIGGHREQRSRWCRDFSRVVSRNDGVTEHYRGTACRYNLRARWRIVRSYRVS